MKNKHIVAVALVIFAVGLYVYGLWPLLQTTHTRNDLSRMAVALTGTVLLLIGSLILALSTVKFNKNNPVP